MERYANLNGNSGVVAYAIGNTWIKVQFTTGSPYTYSYQKAGVPHVEMMKVLAREGRGLNSYIMRNCKYSYD
ncbi:MAG: hypothetical protein AAGU03_03900 [Anaerolineaceae bacterium]